MNRDIFPHYRGNEGGGNWRFELYIYLKKKSHCRGWIFGFLPEIAGYFSCTDIITFLFHKLLLQTIAKLCGEKHKNRWNDQQKIHGRFSLVYDFIAVKLTNRKNGPNFAYSFETLQTLISQEDNFDFLNVKETRTGSAAKSSGVTL